LRPRKQILNSLSEDVREIVADKLERFLLVARGDQRQLDVALEWPRDVADFAVYFGGKRGLREAGANGSGDVRRRRTLGHFLHRPVGKGDLEHLGH
jgi:hypothetical protein